MDATTTTTIDLTKTLAKEWGRSNINVNAVAYGFIDTRLTQSKESQTRFTSVRMKSSLASLIQCARWLLILFQLGDPAHLRKPQALCSSLLHRSPIMSPEKLRKYGGRCVLGLQTVSQLRETYGKDEAQTLLANLSTKLILRAGDNETAEYFSKELGEQDIDRLQMTPGQGASTGGLTNPGHSSESFNTNYNMQRVRQAAIMSSEVLNLPDLQGFLKIPGQPVATVKIDYQAMPEVESAFLS